MCGRYALETSTPEIARILNARDDCAGATARYNIAPTQEVPACRVDQDGGRVLAPLRWGLVPFWARDRKIGQRMINARAETVAEKPAFRAAFRRRRCLVPADGYYEWQRRASGPKQPYYIRAAAGGPLFFAGLWEHWRDPDSGDEMLSFAIVTTTANACTGPIHDRSPVILAPDERAAWLDPGAASAGDLAALLHPPADDLLALHPVSTTVNSPRNDDPRCVEPVADLA